MSILLMAANSPPRKSMTMLACPASAGNFAQFKSVTSIETPVSGAAICSSAVLFARSPVYTSLPPSCPASRSCNRSASKSASSGDGDAKPMAVTVSFSRSNCTLNSPGAPIIDAVPLMSDRLLSNATTSSASSINTPPGKLLNEPLLIVASSFWMAFSALIFSSRGKRACNINSASPAATMSEISRLATDVTPDVLA